MSSLKETIERVGQENPLVHHITNRVTINDCANISLAIGASPVMAMDPREAEEVTALSQALVLNMGTLSESALEAMILSGKLANQLEIPIILDPAGIGISQFRKQGVSRLLEQVNVDVIKGNASEIKTLLGISTSFKGVDSLETGHVDVLSGLVSQLANQLNTVAISTGEMDIISHNNQLHLVKGGHAMLKNISGTGCMLGSLMGAYLAVNPNKMQGGEQALMSMKLAGEKAYDRMRKERSGYGSYRVYLIDEVSRLGHYSADKNESQGER